MTCSKFIEPHTILLAYKAFILIYVRSYFYNITVHEIVLYQTLTFFMARYITHINATLSDTFREETQMLLEIANIVF
jgi:hypothetical protein